MRIASPDSQSMRDAPTASRTEYKLAGFLANGCGVEKDPEQAIVWYEKALPHGETRAKAELERLGYYDAFQVRPCRIEDAQAIGALNQKELGYCVPSDLTDRLQAILDADAERVFVAVSQGEIVGYVHGSEQKSLLGNPRKRIAAMAVAQSHLNLGIEQGLLEKLKQWAAESDSELMVCRESIFDEASFSWKKLLE